LRRVVRRARNEILARHTISGIEWLSRSARGLPLAQPSRHGVRVLTDVPYGAGERLEHRCDVYMPRNRTGQCPVVLYIHGGAYHYLSKDTHWVFGLMFARRGYVVFSIDYRLAPVYRFPAAIEDVCLAARWVKDNAVEYGGDPQRLVFAGESAGAGLATALTVASCYRRPEPYARAVYDAELGPVAWLPACPVGQVSDQDRFERGRKYPLPRFVRAQLTEIEHGYLPPGLNEDERTLADPLVFLERGLTPDRPLPPCFSITSTRDPIMDDAIRLVKAVQTLGAEAEVAIYPGEGHAFHAVALRSVARDAWRDTYRFLDQHVPLTPDAPRER